MECFLCSEYFQQVESYIRHLTINHILKYYDTFRCTHCENVFTNKNSFKRHLIKVHSSLFDIVNKEPECCYTCENVVLSAKGNFAESNVNEPSSSVGISVKDKVTINLHNNNENILSKIQELTENNLKFNAGLYSNNNFCRKDAENIHDSISTNLILPLLNIFKCFANKLDLCLNNELCEIIDKCTNVLNSPKSEHMFVKELKKRDLIDDLNLMVIEDSAELKHKKGSLAFIEKKIFITSISLAHSFKKFLEKNDLFLHILQNMNELSNSTTFTNIVQGDLWKNKCEMYPDKLLIPYFLYSDDIEVNNPLGSHSTAHSVTNFYYSFPTLPCGDTKLEHIFLAASILSKYLKQYGNKKCLKSLVDQLIDLESTGITITMSNGETYNPHFILVLILGDNLGLNSLLGYSKSFSGSFCRLCKIDKKLSQITPSAIPGLNRTYENYSTDLKEKNQSLTGIVNKCVFNRIPSFHVVDNISVDAMHDILEGVCHYDMSFSLLYFIQIKKYFSLKTLNSRKRNFEYGELEIGNSSPDITMTHLKNKHLKMSAREMMTFVTYFPLMIGDLIPTDDDVWLFVMTLVQILDKILAFRVTDFSISSLKAIIETHNNQFMNLFKENLKPKYHILTHYPDVMKKCGPVRKYWCFQFEAKHRGFKIYSHAITSRRNIGLSIEKKYQFVFANYLLESADKCDLITLQKHKIECNLKDFVSSKLNKSPSDLSFYKKVVYKNVVYKSNFFVAERDIDYNIFKIVYIVTTDETLQLFCEKLSNVIYCSHYKAFEVDIHNIEEYTVVDLSNLVGPPITLIKTQNDYGRLSG